VPLNHKEISLLLSELPLEQSRIQKVYQLEVHSLIFELYHETEHFWQLYVEVGTQEARFHRISGPRYVHKTMKKGTKQRFNQYLSSHVEGMVITKVEQLENDRLFTFTLTGKEETLLLIFRLYSASKSNVLVTASDYIIQDLLYRKPNVKEISGEKLIIEEHRVPTKEFTIREYNKDSTFNEFIEQMYMGERKGEREQLIEAITRYYEKEIASLISEKEKTQISLNSTRDYNEYKRVGELLSMNAHLIKKGMDSITIADESGNTTHIPLNPLTSSGENINSYYDKYHKEKNRKEYLSTTLDTIEKNITRLEQELEESNLANLSLKDLRERNSLLHRSSNKSESKYSKAPGLYIHNGKYDILVGRNANENEELLKKVAKGNDYWMHTRDVPGGYVFIKYINGKSVDLETILDAGNLAILFSKAKTYDKADLYFTQVKYLKKVKGGKKGLVLPTNEKTYTVTRDEKRIDALFTMQNGEIR
jgi:predicted ribosome quality control (RQC) complex YloA/Tae2 family protein